MKIKLNLDYKGVFIVLIIFLIIFFTTYFVINNNVNKKVLVGKTGEQIINIGIERSILGDDHKTDVVIVEFVDLECPFCKTMHESNFDRLKKQYIDKDKVLYSIVNFPLPMHDPMSTDLAISSLCVEKISGSEGYFNYIDAIYKNTKSNGIGVGTDMKFNLAINTTKEELETCIDNSTDERAKITKDIELATTMGVQSTPTFFIGKYDNITGEVKGEFVVGMLEYSVFEGILIKYL